MNYETATNYQLNARLAELIGMRVATVDDAPFNYHANDATPEERFSAYRERYPDTVWCLKDGEPWEQYVFTSDWNATMPFAVEHGLDIELPIACLGGIGQITKYIEGDTDVMVDFAIGENPLRAIVICLIKALEQNK